MKRKRIIPGENSVWPKIIFDFSIFPAKGNSADDSKKPLVSAKENPVIRISLAGMVTTATVMYGFTYVALRILLETNKTKRL